MRIADLQGPALNWAVAQCEGYRFGKPQHHSDGKPFFPASIPGQSTLGYVSFDTYVNVPDYGRDWQASGPIIKREGISVQCSVHGTWEAHVKDRSATQREDVAYAHQQGPTPLIAAMRCYVASKRGDDVDIPPELLP